MVAGTSSSGCRKSTLSALPISWILILQNSTACCLFVCLFILLQCSRFHQFSPSVTFHLPFETWTGGLSCFLHSSYSVGSCSCCLSTYSKEHHTLGKPTQEETSWKILRRKKCVWWTFNIKRVKKRKGGGGDLFAVIGTKCWLGQQLHSHSFPVNSVTGFSKEALQGAGLTYWSWLNPCLSGER